jgi:hypothetical protein
VRTLAAAVSSNRDEAFHALMKITAVITAQKPAQRGRVSVRAVIRIARHQGWPDKRASLWDDQRVAFIECLINSHASRTPACARRVRITARAVSVYFTLISRDAGSG